MDLFLWTTLPLHLEYRLILFWCPWDAFSLRLQCLWPYLGMCHGVVGVCSRCGRFLIRTIAQCVGRDRGIEVLWNTWQPELEIVRHITPDLGAFEKALEGPFLILSNWYRLCYRRWTPRSSRGILVAIIDESQRTISLGLRVVNLTSGGRQRYKRTRLSEAELWGMPAADGWSRGRR